MPYYFFGFLISLVLLVYLKNSRGWDHSGPMLIVFAGLWPAILASLVGVMLGGWFKFKKGPSTDLLKGIPWWL